MNSLNDEVIEITYSDVTIIAYEGYKKVIINNEKLNWNNDDEIRYLTLGEISEQLKSLGYKGVFYVWLEDALFGEIYMYGNYDPNEWVRHGTTKGYA